MKKHLNRYDNQPDTIALYNTSPPLNDSSMINNKRMLIRILKIAIAFFVGLSTSCSVMNESSKTVWYHVQILDSIDQAISLHEVGFFSAKSSPSFFESRTYNEAYHSAIQNLQKKAARAGAKYILVTYRSSLDWNFLQVTIEGYAYK